MNIKVATVVLVIIGFVFLMVPLVQAQSPAENDHFQIKSQFYDSLTISGDVHAIGRGQASACSAAEIFNPTSGSTLLGSSMTFQWTDVGAAQYYLYVGISLGASDIHTNAYSSTSATVYGLPVNGAPLYVRLFTRCGDSWVINDYTYTSFGAGEMTNSTPEIHAIWLPMILKNYSGLELTWSETFSYTNNVVPDSILVYKIGGSVRELDVQDGKLKAVIDTPSFGNYTHIHWRPNGLQFSNLDKVTIEYEGYEESDLNLGNNYGGFRIVSVDFPIQKDDPWDSPPFPYIGVMTQNAYNVVFGGFDESGIYVEIMSNAYSVADGNHTYRLELNHISGTYQEGAMRFYRDGDLVATYDDITALMSATSTIEFTFSGDDPAGAIYTWDDVFITVESIGN